MNRSKYTKFNYASSNVSQDCAGKCQRINIPVIIRNCSAIARRDWYLHKICPLCHPKMTFVRSNIRCWNRPIFSGDSEETNNNNDEKCAKTKIFQKRFPAALKKIRSQKRAFVRSGLVRVSNFRGMTRDEHSDGEAVYDFDENNEMIDVPNIEEIIDAEENQTTGDLCDDVALE